MPPPTAQPSPPDSLWSRLSKADKIMAALILLALTFFFRLACCKYGFFNGETNDLTVFAYAFSQTMKGHFMPVYFMPHAILLGCHVNWIILAWLPIYAVWQSFYALLFYQSLMLTAAAWPFYLLAKQVLKNDRAAVVLGAVFLIFPTIASQHVNQIHDDQFALPFVMFAFYFFEREKFTAFLVSALLACMAKESITLTTAAFGVYALFLRRPWKWVLTPLLFSGVYLAVAIFLLQHVFAGMGAPVWEAGYHLGVYGKTYPEVLQTFLTRPGLVLQTAFAPDRVKYLEKLFLPTLYALPFFSFALIVSAPNLLLNLLVPNTAFTVMEWHYNIILGATLLVACVYGIRQLVRWQRQPQWDIALGAAVAMALLALAGTSFWYHAAEYEPQSQSATLRHIVEMIPAEASVVCPDPLLAELSNHPRLLNPWTIFNFDKNPAELNEFDYVIVDGNWRNYSAIAQVPMVQMLRTSQVHRVVFTENNVALLKRIN